MKLLVLFATLAVAASAGLISEWSSFKVHHKKEYGSELEERMRMQIYHENKKMIDAHNEKFEKGLVTYRLSMNHFGDLTPDEFKTLMNGYNKTKMPLGGLTKGQAYVPSNEAVPDTMDWRTKGAVTPVKDQAQCGSCWAFSAVGSLEGQHFLKTGKLVSLSEQNLVDCSGSQGNYGCGGGWMDQAFEYVKENGGIDTEDSYPYDGVDGTCRFNKNTVGATCTGFVDIPAGDEGALKNAVGTVGPISVAIDAGHSSFQFYQSGVYYEPNCSTDMLDHGVLNVGYGTENGQDYWLVKNSWNTVWGDQGYIKMARNKNNHCGIASKASYPTM